MTLAALRAEAPGVSTSTCDVADEFGIRVNAILPGAVEGPRLQQVFAGRAAASGRTTAEEETAALANQSIKHFVDPSDIAALALFLASDAARSISGQMIPIDGDSQSAS